MPLQATPTPARTLLDPKNHALMLIDHQPQMAFATKSIDGVLLRNNAALVAHSARIFEVATILTTVAAKSFSGPMFDEITTAYPKAKVIDRTTMNAWEDPHVIEEFNKLGKTKVVLSGLWTSVCVAGPALSAIEQGFEVYVIADACGDVSKEAHQRATERMVQAGVRPITSITYLLELQRDWARADTYEAVTDLAGALGGAYGLGITYAKTMFGGQENKHVTGEGMATEAARVSA
jgi:nicotinamidase-related amidase